MGETGMSELLNLHLDALRLRNLRPSTISKRRRVILRLAAAFGCDAELASPNMLADWWTNLTISPESKGVDLAHVRQFYKWLVYEGWRPDDPTTRLIRPKTYRRLPRPISDPDLQLALFTASTRVLPWLTLGAFAGLRACEIAPLCREDVFEHADPPKLVVVDGKGGKQRVVPCHSKVAALLPELPSSGRLFANLKTDGPLPAHRVSQEANLHLHSLGITSTFHSLRHWFGTRVYQQSLDLRLTQDLMGHQDPKYTAGYAAWSPGKATEVVETLRLGG